MAGRSLAEVEWVTTPPRERPRSWSGPSGKVDPINRVPRAFAAWARQGAMERWRELVDAEERRRALTRTDG